MRAKLVVGVMLALVAGVACSAHSVPKASFGEGRVPPPPNDDYQHSRTVTHLPTTFIVSTAGATRQLGEPTSCARQTRTVWYVIPAIQQQQDQQLLARLTGDSSSLAVYTGNRLKALSGVACSAGSTSPRVRFTIKPGHRYFLQVGGVGNRPIRLVLSLPNGGKLVLPSKPSVSMASPAPQ